MSLLLALERFEIAQMLQWHMQRGCAGHKLPHAGLASYGCMRLRLLRPNIAWSMTDQ
jgi:hypothetical protein